MRSPRTKTPCPRQQKLEANHGHTMSYRDPEDPEQGLVKLNSFLGLDRRGHRALSCLRNHVKKGNTNIETGRRTGVGLLGQRLKARGVDLGNHPPTDRLEEEQF